MSQAGDILRGALARLNGGDGWIGVAYAVDEHSAPVSPDNPEAVAYCGFGAFMAVKPGLAVEGGAEAYRIAEGALLAAAEDQAYRQEIAPGNEEIDLQVFGILSDLLYDGGGNWPQMETIFRSAITGADTDDPARPWRQRMTTAKATARAAAEAAGAEALAEAMRREQITAIERRIHL